MDLIMRARDVRNVSSIYVSKKPHEFPYFARYRFDPARGMTVEASENDLPKTRLLVLDEGRIIFDGSVDEFQQSDQPRIKELIDLDHHDHSADPYFPDPWDKRRRPSEEVI